MTNSTHSKDYVVKTADWRETLRRNTRRTYFVILLFLCIYAGIGLIIDTILYTESTNGVTPAVTWHAFMHMEWIPYATLIMLIIASISLLISIAFHDRLMLLGTESREITVQTANSAIEKQLMNIVEEMRIASGISIMPRVFIIDAPYMNAFASGYSEKSALIAVTSGLLSKLNRDELQAVVAHELSHIHHMDIKLTLIATLLANLSVIALDIGIRALMIRGNGNRKNGGTLLIFALLVLRFVLPLATLLLLLFLSRSREYMADAGAVKLMRTNEPLANALLKIEADYQTEEAASIPEPDHEQIRRSAYLYEPKATSKLSFTELFSTHPSIQKRLEAIGYYRSETK